MMRFLDQALIIATLVLHIGCDPTGSQISDERSPPSEPPQSQQQSSDADALNRECPTWIQLEALYCAYLLSNTSAQQLASIRAADAKVPTSQKSMFWQEIKALLDFNRSAGNQSPLDFRSIPSMSEGNMANANGSIMAKAQIKTLTSKVFPVLEKVRVAYRLARSSGAWLFVELPQPGQIISLEVPCAASNVLALKFMNTLGTELVPHRRIEAGPIGFQPTPYQLWIGFEFNTQPTQSAYYQNDDHVVELTCAGESIAVENLCIDSRIPEGRGSRQNVYFDGPGSDLVTDVLAHEPGSPYLRRVCN
jgi:hypothetical protein